MSELGGLLARLKTASPGQVHGLAVQIVSAWLGDHAWNGVVVGSAESREADLLLESVKTSETWPIKVSGRLVSASSRRGKSFEIRRSVLDSTDRGIAVLVLFDRQHATDPAQCVKAAWAIPFDTYRRLAGAGKSAQQCRPAFDPDVQDKWSSYRCGSSGELCWRLAQMVESPSLSVGEGAAQHRRSLWNRLLRSVGEVLERRVRATGRGGA